MSRTALKALFFGMSMFMIYLATITSIKSDMFHLSPIVTNEPWFRTTLVDFYFNITIISAWVIYKEANWLRSLGWTVAFIVLGSIATAFYVFLQLAASKEGEGIEMVLLRRKT